MNTVVNQLLEADHQAKQLLDEARQYHEQTMAEMEKEREHLRAKYLERATQRIQQLEQAESQHIDEATTAISSQHELLAQQMEAVYTKNHVSWEDALFRRCTAMED